VKENMDKIVITAAVVGAIAASLVYDMAACL